MLPIQAIARASAMLAATALVAACSKAAETTTEESGAHTHPPKFGGEVVEAGDHFANIEVVHDEATGKLTVYTLDGHNEELIKVPEEALTVSIVGHDFEPFEMTLAANVSTLTNDTLGSSSMFVGQSDTIKGADDFHGTVATVTLKGKAFSELKFDIGGGHDDDGEDHEGHDH